MQMPLTKDKKITSMITNMISANLIFPSSYFSLVLSPVLSFLSFLSSNCDHLFSSFLSICIPVFDQFDSSMSPNIQPPIALNSSDDALCEVRVFSLSLSLSATITMNADRADSSVGRERWPFSGFYQAGRVIRPSDEEECWQCLVID